MLHQGRCHCGAIQVVFESEVAPADLPVRLCSCSFCRKHGALAATDLAGRLRISLEDVASAVLYRFGHRTADFLICRTCGVYVAAILEDSDKLFATLNVRVLDDSSAFKSPPSPVTYDGEDAGDRTERRRNRWTPAEISIGRMPAA